MEGNTLVKSDFRHLSMHPPFNLALTMVSVSGYLIGSQAVGRIPLPPQAELQWWYQFYFATNRVPYE